MSTCTCVTGSQELGSAVTVVNRSVFRGDTLFFASSVYQDVQTKQLFSVPAAFPPLVPPPDSVPVNLTGSRVIFTAKYNVVSPDNGAIWSLDSAALGGVTIDSVPASGRFTVAGPPLATRSFPDDPVHLVFDIQVIDVSGRVTTVEAGTLTVLPDVSRAIT